MKLATIAVMLAFTQVGALGLEAEAELEAEAGKHHTKGYPRRNGWYTIYKNRGDYHGNDEHSDHDDMDDHSESEDDYNYMDDHSESDDDYNYNSGYSGNTIRGDYPADQRITCPDG